MPVRFEILKQPSHVNCTAFEEFELLLIEKAYIHLSGRDGLKQNLLQSFFGS